MPENKLKHPRDTPHDNKSELVLSPPSPKWWWMSCFHSSALPGMNNAGSAGAMPSGGQCQVATDVGSQLESHKMDRLVSKYDIISARTAESNTWKAAWQRSGAKTSPSCISRAMPRLEISLKQTQLFWLQISIDGLLACNKLSLVWWLEDTFLKGVDYKGLCRHIFH